MVVTPAIVVPDQSSWTMWGRDPAQAGLRPVEAPERARQLLVPDPVPEALAEAVRDAWSRIPPPRSYVAWARGDAGVPAADLLEAKVAGEPEHGGQAHGDGDHSYHGRGSDEQGAAHGGHDHDMMAIVGEPSADGLVMESIDFQLGPLAPGLPGGLVLELSLDGDVVDRCHPRATLEMPLGPLAGGGFGDPLAPAAWTAAIGTALENAAGRPASEATARLRVAAVETERALSHLCWLRDFGFVLGWAQLSERAHGCAVALMGPRLLLEEAGLRPQPGGLDRDQVRRQLEAVGLLVGGLRRGLEGSRRLRARTRGRAKVAAETIRGLGVTGPPARAAGVPGDTRNADPLYEALGFREALLDEGDAEARTELRVTEAVAAVDLAVAALADEGSSEQGAMRTPAGSVEGPRGPVRAQHGDGRLQVVAPANARLLELAGEAVVGLELGRALTGVASFDLSGWRVRG